MKVLFCTDGSEASLHAINKTLSFIKPDYQIDVVYVIDKKIFSHANPKDKEKILSFHQKTSQEILDKTIKYIESLKYKATNTSCPCGHPASEIIKLAKSQNYNLIVLGSHGKSDIAHWLGSISREVIMNSICPVLVARPPKKTRLFQKEVLVTINDSEISGNAVKKMIETLDLKNASIEIMTVIYDPESLPIDLAFDEHWITEYMKKEKKADKTLANAKKLFEENNISVKSTFHLEGFTAKEIIDYIKENPKDLIVMGTHGRDEITSFLLGSVSKRVLDHSTSPVLIVPNKKRPE